MRSSIGLVGLVVALVIAMAACGGDDGVADPATADSAPAAEPAEDAAAAAADEVLSEAEGALEEGVSDPEGVADGLIKVLREQLERSDSAIAELEQELNGLEGDAREEAERRLEDLQGLQVQARAELEALDVDSPDALEDAIGEITRLLEDLAEALPES